MIPLAVEQATRIAAMWVRRLTDDWVTVKVEIMGELSNEGKKLFTRRDELTKENFSLNDMELELVALWREITGVELKLRSYKERREDRRWTPTEKIRRRYGDA